MQAGAGRVEAEGLLGVLDGFAVLPFGGVGAGDLGEDVGVGGVECHPGEHLLDGQVILALHLIDCPERVMQVPQLVVDGDGGLVFRMASVKLPVLKST